MGAELEPWEGGKPWVKGPPSKAQRLALLQMVGDRAGHIPQKPKMARDRIYQGLVARGLFSDGWGDVLRAALAEKEAGQ